METDLDKCDIFVGVLEGSDGEVNHAIGIFDDWMFDSNENVAMSLHKEGLNHCVSDCETDVEFVKFKRGFFFRDQSDNTKKLKRKCDSMDSQTPSQKPNAPRSFFTHLF